MISTLPQDFPDFLKDLLQPTPSSIAKLLAAWDGLSIETQIYVLIKLDEIPTPLYLIERVKIKALDSDNAYVRYLGAHKFNFKNDHSSRDREIKEKIENDENPLVRYSLYENSSSISSVVFDDDDLKDADSFFALPHLARLAKVRMLNGCGDKMATILTEAAIKQLQDGSVSETELYEIITDYLVKPEFQKEYADKYVSYDGCEFIGDELIERLWQLVPLLPTGITHVLIDNLPKLSQRQSVPENIIELLTVHQLETLLNRKDIELADLRKKIFKETVELRGAAVSSNFSLTYSEFADILAGSPTARISTLKLLGTMAPELDICLYEAIHDLVVASDENRAASVYENSSAWEAVVKRLNHLNTSSKKKEMTELRLYRLAKIAIPWEPETKGFPPSGNLEFLAEKIIPGSTWDTFMAFSEAWSQISSEQRRGEKQLPRLYDLGEDDLPRDDSTINATTNSHDFARINDEVSRGVANVFKEIKEIRKELLEGIERIGKELSEQKSQLGQETELRLVMQEQISTLRRKRLFSSITIFMLGIMVWLRYGAR